MASIPENVEYKVLTREELIALAGEELPEKAIVSLINANVAAPVQGPRLPTSAQQPDET